MSPLESLRRRIGDICAGAGLGRPSLKRARQDTFLLVMHGGTAIPLLQAEGFVCLPLGGDRWGLEPPALFYQGRLPEALLWRPGAAYQLYRLLLLHPQEDAVDAGRRLVKAIEAKEIEKVCRELCGLCAERLRKKEKLPGGLTGPLAYYLACEEDALC